MSALVLTDKQREVMALIAEGASDKEAADQLGVSFHTIRAHVQNALTANDLTSRLRLAVLIERENR